MLFLTLQFKLCHRILIYPETWPAKLKCLLPTCWLPRRNESRGKHRHDNTWIYSISSIQWDLANFFCVNSRRLSSHHRCLDMNNFIQRLYVLINSLFELKTCKLTKLNRTYLLVCLFFKYKWTVCILFYNKKHQGNIVQTRQIQTKPYWHEAFQCSVAQHPIHSQYFKSTD